MRAGNIKAYAVMAKKRWLAAPDVPTVDEAGVPGLYVSTWHGIWAPKGTPTDIVAKLNAAAVAALADPAVQQRHRRSGHGHPAARAADAGGASRAFHKAEIEKWWPIIKAAGIKAE